METFEVVVGRQVLKCWKEEKSRSDGRKGSFEMVEGASPTQLSSEEENR